MKRIFETTDEYDIVLSPKKVKKAAPEQDTPPPAGNNSPKKKATWKLKLQRFIAVLLIFSVTMGVIGSSMIWAFAVDAWKKAPDLYAEDFNTIITTQFLDDSGEAFYTAGLKTADAITYDELPQTLVDAFVATEDSRFFEHNGVDIPRFTKAMAINVRDSIKRAKLTFSQGGSTITMQLIKNIYFVNEDVQTGESNLAASSGVEGVRRKVQELYLATKLEKEEIITKKEQIAIYLNTIYFGAGNNTMGIQSSARRYFDKDVSELNLIESAFMAGVINAPHSYSPYISIRNAKERTDTILDLMLLHGYITEDELKVAKAIELENIFVDRLKKAEENYKFQAYADLVIDEVEELTGFKPHNAPMIVHTNMNANVQEAIDKVQNREIARLNPGEDSYVQMGSAVVENGTGAIVGVFGGYDYNGQLLFNHAKKNKETPGSVVKALLSYPLAFEHLGISSEHIVTDAPYVLAGMTAANNGQINNYDGVYLGDIPLQFAFSDSRNTVAITLLEQVQDTIGRDNVIKYLNNIGFTDVKAKDFNVQFAIGGDKFATSPLQLAEALSTVMNGGEHIKPTTIKKIEFLNGQEPKINEPKSESFLSQGSAYLTTELMRNAVSGPNAGFSSVLRRGYPVFGKTGTHKWDKTQAELKGYPKGATQNRNMLTATDRFSIATWVGFSDPKAPKQYLDDRVTNMNIPGNFNGYLLDILASEYGPGETIPRPDDVVEITHIKGPFPYQRPIEGMRSDMIVTGLINKRYLSLTDPKPQSLSNLDEVNVESSQMGRVISANVHFTPYPDESKLTIAPPTREMPLPTSDRVYTGQRLYDESWIFGSVEYVVDVVIDGEISETIRSSHNVVGATINVPAGAKVSLCGYYGFSNLQSVISNRICKDVEVEQVAEDSESIALPTVNESVAQFKREASKAGIRYSIQRKDNSDRSQFGIVNSVTKDKDASLSGRTFLVSDLKKSEIIVSINDFTYDIAAQPATTKGKFYNDFSSIINIKQPKDTEMQEPLKAFGGSTKVDLLDYYSKQLTLN